MGKHSGRNAFRTKLKELGYELGDNAFEDAFVRFKDLADRKKHVYDEDIEALVDEDIATAHDRIKVVSLTVIAGTQGPQSATLTLDIDGDASHRAGDRQRPGGRDLQRHQGAGAARGDARALPGARRDRGHGRAGRGVRAARGGRPHGDGPRRRPRHAGRLRAGLSRALNKLHGEARRRRRSVQQGDLTSRANRRLFMPRRRGQEPCLAACTGMGISSSRPRRRAPLAVSVTHAEARSPAGYLVDHDDAGHAIAGSVR